MKPTRLTRAAAGAAVASTLLLTAACGSDDDASGAETSSAPTSAATSEAPAAGDATEPAGGAATAFKAGDYDAEGSYQTPAGTQSVEVEVSLDEAGTITAVEVDPQAEGGNSEMFQKKFAGGISDVVVGKRITDLDVSKVAGSSLTSGGFNAAIEDIVEQAQA
jgi:uncharacterized protein with FMN-binding domain